MSRRNARHRMLRCQSSTRGSGDSSTMPRREYGRAGPRSRGRRPTSRPHAGFSPTDNCAGTRICTRSPHTCRRRPRGGSCRRGLTGAHARRFHPGGTAHGGHQLRDPGCRAVERDALGRCSSVVIQWDTCRRRSWPMPNAPGSAAIEPGTLTCRIRDPPPRSRSLSWPARGGRTTGVAGGGKPPGQALRLCLYLSAHRKVLVCVMLAKWQPSNPPCLSGGFRSTHRPFSIPRGSHARSFDSCPETSSSGRATRALT